MAKFDEKTKTFEVHIPAALSREEAKKKLMDEMAHFPLDVLTRGEDITIRRTDVGRVEQDE